MQYWNSQMKQFFTISEENRNENMNSSKLEILVFQSGGQKLKYKFFGKYKFHFFHVRNILTAWTNDRTIPTSTLTSVKRTPAALWLESDRVFTYVLSSALVHLLRQRRAIRNNGWPWHDANNRSGKSSALESSVSCRRSVCFIRRVSAPLFRDTTDVSSFN